MDDSKKDKSKKSLGFILLLIALFIIVGGVVFYFLLDNGKKEKVNSNCINTDTYNYDDVGEAYGMFGITPTLIDSNTVEFEVDGTMFEPLKSSVINYQGELDLENYKFKYISNEKINKVYIGGFGQIVCGREYIFLIMEDGSVMYKALFDKDVDSNGEVIYTSGVDKDVIIKDFNKLESIDNVIKIVQSYKAEPSSTGATTMIAYIDEERFYDLEPLILK